MNLALKDWLEYKSLSDMLGTKLGTNSTLFKGRLLDFCSHPPLNAGSTKFRSWRVAPYYAVFARAPYFSPSEIASVSAQGILELGRASLCTERKGASRKTDVDYEGRCYIPNSA